MNRSEEVTSVGVQIDYLRILLLVWGATIPAIYYGLQCHQWLQIIYCVAVCPPDSSPPERATTPQASPLLTHLRSLALHPRPRLSHLHPNPLVPPSLRQRHTRPFIHRLHPRDPHPRLPQHRAVWLASPKPPRQFESPARRPGIQFHPRPRPRLRKQVPRALLEERTFDLFGRGHQIMQVAVLGAAMVHLFGMVRHLEHLHRAPLCCNQTLIRALGR